MPTEIVLILIGDLPSKKNRIHTGRGKRGHYDDKTRATICNLILQARTQWGPEPPAGRRTDIKFILHLANFRKDRDGIVTTLLDCLKQARVLEDDSALAWNGWLVVAPVLETDKRNERAEIILTVND